MPPAETSYVDALAVPGLVQACTSVLDTEQQPGSGLKVLRLLNFDTHQVLMSAVQGYTLQLGGDPYSKHVEIVESACLLKQTRLVCLRLGPSPPTPGPREYPSLAKSRARTEVAEQLLLFLGEMDLSLSSVTRLEITLGNSFTAEALETAAANKWFDPIAHSLPQLQQLSVNGMLDVRALRDLGGFCKQLTTLEVKVLDLPTGCIGKLQSLLPHLTNLILLPTARFQRVSIADLDTEMRAQITAACQVLKSCPSLVSFHNGPYPLTGSIWFALPPALQELRAYSLSFLGPELYNLEPPQPRPASEILPPNPWKVQHAGLLRLHIMCAESMWLHEIAEYLRAAPQLAALDIEFEAPALQLMYCPTRPADLQLLSTRCAAGLVLTFKQHSCTAASDHSLVIHAGLYHYAHVWAKESIYRERTGPEPGEVTTAEFLACLSPLPGITHVDLRGGGCLEGGLCLSHITRIFPCLRELTVNDMKLSTSDLLNLAACKTVRKVVLQHVGGLTVAGLAMFCEHVPSLRNLSILECDGFDSEWKGEELSALLLAGKASGVKVFVEDEYIEREPEQFRDPSYSDEGDEGGEQEEGEEMDQQEESKGVEREEDEGRGFGEGLQMDVPASSGSEDDASESSFEEGEESEGD